MRVPARMYHFYLYTYTAPEIHIEPMLEFVGEICNLGRRTDLPISLWNVAVPREVFYDENSWERFKKRVRQGKIKGCTITHYSQHGMTIHSSLASTPPHPFQMDAEFVPAGGIQPGSRNREFGSVELLVELGKITRYPTNLSLRLDMDAFGLPADTNFARHLHELERQLVTTSAAAYACCEKVRTWPDAGTIPRSPNLLDDESLIDSFDSHTAGVFWGMFLGRKHIEKLGGKKEVFRILSRCRVDDLSTAEEDRVYIQLTEGMEDFNESVAEEYRRLFEPLLRKE